MTVFPLPEFDLSGSRTCITSPFGPRGGGPHNGTDIGSVDGIEIGVDVCANDAGVVIRQSRDPGTGAGLNLWLLTDVEVNGRRVGYKDFHLSAIVVPTGTRVAEGEHIAEVGNSGNVAAHLHQQKHLVPVRAGVDPVFWDWSDATAVDNTPELRRLLAERRFPGSSTPAPTPPEEDVMATAAELRQIVREEIISADANERGDNPNSNLQLHGDMLGVAALVAAGGGNVDTAAIVAALRDLPADVVAAIKAAL